MKRPLLICFFYLASILVFSQDDTVRVWDAKAVKKAWIISEINNSIILENKKVLYIPYYCNLLHNLLGPFVGNRQHIIKTNIENKVNFSKVNFYGYRDIKCPTSYAVTPLYQFQRGLSFDKCTIRDFQFDGYGNHFAIRNYNGWVSFSKSEIENIELSGSETTTIVFDKNVLLGSLYFLNLRQSEFFISDNEMKNDSSMIAISYSTIKGFEFGNNNLKTHISFSQDSILGPVIFSQQHIYKGGKVFFFNCYINTSIDIYSTGLDAVFSKCTFGPNTSLNIAVDTLSLIDCEVPQKSLSLNCYSDPSSRTVLINRRTSFENIDFNYLGNFQLCTDSMATSEEGFTSTYENMLASLKNRDKKKSYQKLDIEYKQKTYSPFWNTVHYYWWNYGYNKEWVFYWTFSLLGIFYLFNLFCWRWIENLYPILKLHRNKVTRSKKLSVQKISTRALNFIRYLVTVLIYTFFIFFSLRINFEKLRYTKTWFLVVFFIQYCSGLWCLFFIGNYLLHYD